MAAALPNNQLIDVEEFDKWPRWNLQGRDEWLALHNIPAGKCLIFGSHGDYKCPNGRSSGCHLAAAAYRVGKRRGFIVSTKHFPDGRVAVAFFQ